MTKKIVIVGILIILLLAFALSGCTTEEKKDEKKSGPVEASSGDVEISNVYHKPDKPKSGGEIDYYADVKSLPAGYSVILYSEEYNGSKLSGSSALNMRKKSGNQYSTGDYLSDTNGRSLLIKYWINIYSKDFDSIDDFETETPFLQSLEHNFTI